MPKGVCYIHAETPFIKIASRLACERCERFRTHAVNHFVSLGMSLRENNEIYNDEGTHVGTYVGAHLVGNQIYFTFFKPKSF